MGHAFTVHRSFIEVLPHLETGAERDLCAERYAEFVASQLAENDATRDDAARPLDGFEVDETEVVERALAHPGFLGHTVISLGYVARCRGDFDPPRWRYALARVREMAEPAVDDASDVVVERPPRPASEQTLTSALHELIEQGPRDVHTLTLADAACDVWDAWPRQRVAVEHVLLRFANHELRRAPSGERSPAQ